MKVKELFRKKALDNINEGAVTIAFLGDSVTQGCFEIYQEGEKILTVFDNEHAYYNCLRKIFGYIYPSVPINIIKAGISGVSTPHGVKRLEQDVLRFQPDLVVVCYGLNDVTAGLANIGRYKETLAELFRRLQETQTEVIFMTPNMLNTRISPFLTGEKSISVAERTCKLQNEGVMDTYMDEAREVCKEYKVRVCDCYRKWKLLAESGVDTTSLLCNHINHPSREMSWLFAVSLVETMMTDEDL